METNNKWICTDPDNNQYRLNEGQNVWKDTKFTFKENEKELTIELKEYTLTEINNTISSYGYFGNGAVYYIDGTDTEISNDIIAECIFESEI